MDLLIMGGTRFVGRHIVTTALERGHTVTLFNRGRSNPGLFADQGVEEIHGDRDGDIGLLAGRQWDAVVDVNGYLPRIVRASAELLAPVVDQYLFISSISVYASPWQPHSNEDAPLATLEDPEVEEVTSETYGGLKVLCEKVVQEVYGSRALIVRPGLIVGPDDYTDRFTYWPVRVARGGRVLAPGDGSQPVQFIDVRDLASWCIHLLETRQYGVFNATGPAERLSFQQFLFTCREVTGSDARFIWVSDAFLQRHDVQPYRDLPHWVPGEAAEAHGTIDISRAIAAGLTFRPLQDTIARTLQWAAELDEGHEWRAGLSPEREQELLQAWEEGEGEVSDS